MTSNFFDFYKIPVAFHPDQQQIRKSYLAVSRAFHPDLSEKSHEESEEMTSMNNQAYKTLTNKDLRVRHVLEILGEGMSDADKLPPMFLMEMMDWNERISELGEDVNEIKQVKQDFAELEKEFDDRLNELTSRFDADQDKNILKEIKEICLKQKYLLRLKDSINTFATP